MFIKWSLLYTTSKYPAEQFQTRNQVKENFFALLKLYTEISLEITYRPGSNFFCIVLCSAALLVRFSFMLWNGLPQWERITASSIWKMLAPWSCTFCRFWVSNVSESPCQIHCKMLSSQSMIPPSLNTCPILIFSFFYCCFCLVSLTTDETFCFSGKPSCLNIISVNKQNKNRSVSPEKQRLKGI